jgi:catechol 2,3-dioxygenase-like lactoylglutathione lyase family enzyme
VSVFSAIHFYVTDLDRSMDFYTRLLSRGPQAAYDEGENAQSAFFVIDGNTHLVLTWDLGRGKEVGAGVRLELAAEDLDGEIAGLEARGLSGSRARTRFGTDVFDLVDPDGHLIRVGPPWALRDIEGAV